VLTGSASKIGGEMTRSPIVRKLTFTGSTEVGRTLMRQSADTIKKLSLELGGNAPFIVFDDADIDAAVDGAMVSKYRNTGQTCVCANRLYVQRGVLQAFTDKLVAKVKALKVGNGVDAGVNQVGDPVLDSTRRKELERQAMTKAVEDARLNAETLATAAGVKLGTVRMLNGNTSPPSVPIYRAKAMMAADAVASPEETYQAGEMKFSAMVNAEYDLVP